VDVIKVNGHFRPYYCNYTEFIPSIVGALFLLLGELLSEAGFKLKILFFFVLNMLKSFNRIDTLLSYAPFSSSSISSLINTYAHYKSLLVLMQFFLGYSTFYLTYAYLYSINFHNSYHSKASSNHDLTS
jgi:hypothetical protein